MTCSTRGAVPRTGGHRPRTGLSAGIPASWYFNPAGIYKFSSALPDDVSEVMIFLGLRPIGAGVPWLLSCPLAGPTSWCNVVLPFVDDCLDISVTLVLKFAFCFSLTVSYCATDGFAVSFFRSVFPSSALLK